MLSFVNYAEYGAHASADELKRLGGLQAEEQKPKKDKEEMDDDVDDGEAKAMDVNEDDGNAITEEALVYPEPKPLIHYSGNTNEFFTFDKHYIPATFPQIPVQVLLATSGEATVAKKAMAKQMAAVCAHPCLPLIVHASPIISFFENSTKDVDPIQKRTFVSFMFSCVQLHQFKMDCVVGAFPFHETMTPKKFEKINDNYATQLRIMENDQNVLLDAMYDEFQKTQNENALMLEFVSLMESYCLRYIHLIEYYLYTCLIEPHDVNGVVPLQSVLTPHVLPSLNQIPFDAREGIVQDMYKFFDFKRNIMECEEIQPFTYDSAAAAENTYKKLIPMKTLWEYCRAMNREQI
ncbi:MAG: hypothetical protein K2Q45_00450 [Nitrosomonas sp.]|nr:hypothetical protein [Nitrosomonas sp.]